MFNIFLHLIRKFGHGSPLYIELAKKTYNSWRCARMFALIEKGKKSLPNHQGPTPW
jgi:hypothetical protein